MSDLARWLDHNRTAVLPHWLALVAGVPAGANGNGATIHPDERTVLLSSIYESLIPAAAGETAQLDECLRLARALRATPGEDGLAAQIGSTFALRRAARERLLATGGPMDEPRPLIEQFDRLVEHMVLTLTSYWTASAAAVAQELQQTELLAASLNSVTEQADRIALQLSQLNEIARAMTSSVDPHQLLDLIGGKLAEVLEVAQVLICLPEDEGRLRVERGWGRLGSGLAPQIVDGDGDLLLRAYRGGELVLDLRPDPAAQGPWHVPGHAVLAVPMPGRDRAIGVIVLQDDTPEIRLAREQQNLVSSVASQAAIAIENARYVEQVRGFNVVLEQRIAERTRELQAERDTLETLLQIGLEVGSTLDLDLLLQTCLDVLARLVGVSHGSIMLIERETDQLVDRAMLGAGHERNRTRFQLGQGVAGWVAQHKKPALIDDVTVDPRWIPPPAPVDRGMQKTDGSMLAVPLVAHHEVVGVIVLSHEARAHFTEGHLRLLNAAAGEIALGIYNATLYDELQREVLLKGERLQMERRANAQRDAIFQSLSDGVIVCSAEGVVMAANPAAARILDWEVEELLTWNLPDLLHRLLAQRSPELPIEDLLERPYGEHGDPRHLTTTLRIGTREVSVSLGPVTAANEEMLGAVAVFRDITREVESDRLKDEFIGAVSHELRTPMTSIKGYTQLLAMGSLGPLTDTQREFLHTITTNAERMITIINDLLDITKIETGSILNEMDIRPLHLAEALSGVIAELQPRIVERGQALTVVIPPGLPLARVDARGFKQILGHLVTNAVKFTPRAGTIAVEMREATEEAVPIDLREGLRPGRFILVDVRDTGVGIAPEDQPRIFDRFYRTENALKIEAGGTGLGLALVKPLVRLFGGRIWVRSTVGQGSTFSFVVPGAS